MTVAGRAVAALLELAIRVYQIAISPIFAGACRFEPSCSQYGIEAIRRHGAAHGGWLTIRRITRCHPFGASGWDPVPEGDHRGP